MFFGLIIWTYRRIVNNSLIDSYCRGSCSGFSIPLLHAFSRRVCNPWPRRIPNQSCHSHCCCHCYTSFELPILEKPCKYWDFRNRKLTPVADSAVDCCCYSCGWLSCSFCYSSWNNSASENTLRRTGDFHRGFCWTAPRGCDAPACDAWHDISAVAHLGTHPLSRFGRTTASMCSQRRPRLDPSRDRTQSDPRPKIPPRGPFQTPREVLDLSHH